jgi:hypothetical protein
MEGKWMGDEDDIIRLGGSDEVLRFIQERSDDIDKAVILRGQIVTFRDKEGVETRYEAGLVLFLCDESTYLVHPQDTVKVLEDGIFERMRIKTEIQG